MRNYQIFGFGSLYAPVKSGSASRGRPADICCGGPGSTWAKGAPQQVPALLVGRLATDTRVAGLGLGTEMVKHSLATAAELNIKAACRAVVVTALNIDAFRWWQRFGFEPFDVRDTTNLDLYLLTKDVAATLGQL